MSSYAIRAAQPNVNDCSFFSHLIDTLGAEDFLGPMNMLLVLLSQPQSGKKTSKNASDIAFLIKSVTERFPVETVLRVSNSVTYDCRL